VKGAGYGLQGVPRGEAPVSFDICVHICFETCGVPVAGDRGTEG
jgi:hypothetical protein